MASPGGAAAKLASFAFGEPSPHAVFLPDTQGVVEAVGSDGAHSAASFRFFRGLASFGVEVGGVNRTVGCRRSAFGAPHPWFLGELKEHSAEHMPVVSAQIVTADHREGREAPGFSRGEDSKPHSYVTFCGGRAGVATERDRIPRLRWYSEMVVVV